MNTKDIPHKLIDASRLLLAKFQEPVKNDYQRGWNDALQTAFEEETGIIFLKEGKGE